MNSDPSVHVVASSMDVYLVPVSRERYELYCEVPDEPDGPAENAPRGFTTRLKERFRAVIAEAER